jgi:hypothetical protein
MESATVMYSSTFGGAPSLTEGLLLRKKDGTYYNDFFVYNNGGFQDRAFTVNYGGKVPSGTYSVQLKKNWKEVNGAMIQLDGKLGDYLELVVNDDLTENSKFNATAQGCYIPRL